MAKTNKIRLYAFVGAIMVLLLPVALFYLWPDSSPPDSNHTSTPDRTKSTQETTPPPHAVPANITPNKPPTDADNHTKPTVEPAKVQKQHTSTSLISTGNLGKTITVEGVPVNYKIEAAVSVKEGGMVWLKGQSPWPNDVATVRGQQVRVTGVLSEDYGGGAVIWDNKAGSRQMPHGHPVPPGTDLKKVNHRFIIINAEWEIIDK